VLVRLIRSFFYHLPKTTTESFATIVPISGELHFSGVRKTVKLQLTTFANSGKR
jgi:hypothetical protein